MESKFIKTNLGAIYIEENIVEGTTPIIFLHGTYFDHYLWDYQISKITDHTTITIDMPLHGKSKKDVPELWNFDDTVEMLIQIIEKLKIPKVIAIGQSWGAMVILRAAYKFPNRFRSLGLCNMPFTEVDEEKKKLFEYSHSILNDREIFLGLASEVFLSENNRNNKGIINYFKKLFANLTDEEIIRIDKSSSLITDDARPMIDDLKVRSLALIGKDDFVGSYKNLETQIVEGGHISPLEAKNEVLGFIKKVIGQKQ